MTLCYWMCIESVAGRAEFYTPPVVADAMTVMRQLAGIAAFPHGGYAQAERARIVVGQEEVIEALKADPQQVSCKARHKCGFADCSVLSLSAEPFFYK